MAENNHLLHAVRCSHTNTVLARQVVGRLLNVHIRGFGLLGVDDMDTAALLDRAGASFDLIGIEHENKMTPAHALIIAQHVDERFAGGVDITGGNVAQLVPREDDVVAVHEQIIVLTDAGDVQLLERRGLFTALLEGFKAAVFDWTVGAFKQGSQFRIAAEAVSAACAGGTHRTDLFRLFFLRFKHV